MNQNTNTTNKAKIEAMVEDQIAFFLYGDFSVLNEKWVKPTHEHLKGAFKPQRMRGFRELA